MNDESWKALVREHASDVSPFTPTQQARRDQVVAYLWKDVATYKRLAESLEGKFIREVATTCPDLGLRAAYRKQLIVLAKDSR